MSNADDLLSRREFCREKLLLAYSPEDLEEQYPPSNRGHRIAQAMARNCPELPFFSIPDFIIPVLAAQSKTQPIVICPPRDGDLRGSLACGGRLLGARLQAGHSALQNLYGHYPNRPRIALVGIIDIILFLGYFKISYF